MRSTCLDKVSSNLLNELSSLFGILKYVCDIVVKKFTFAISSADEFLLHVRSIIRPLWAATLLIRVKAAIATQL